MAKLICSFPFFFVFLLKFCHLSPAAGDPYSGAPKNNSAADDFIRSSCAKTMYPEICYSSLSGYANAVHQDAAQLARVAISVSLSKIRRISAFVSNLTRESPDSRPAAALRDCASTLRDAEEQINDSLRQMRRLGPGSGNDASLRFMLSNVQTWMSAALTDEETCTDGLEEAAAEEEGAKEMMKRKVGEGKMYTSNALALVNSYAESVTRK